MSVNFLSLSLERTTIYINREHKLSIHYQASPAPHRLLVHNQR
ncbi:hypothetical protein [Vibrio gallaecicus]|nr:hypothetical protein [Vibrio gallaecicus]MDN3615337.1 hypothetical protein [Vibrio gallaecicus]